MTRSGASVLDGVRPTLPSWLLSAWSWRLPVVKSIALLILTWPKPLTPYRSPGPAAHIAPPLERLVRRRPQALIQAHGWRRRGWTASNGLVQGCHLSCAAQNALMMALARDLDASLLHPHVDWFPTFYAEDAKVELYRHSGQTLMPFPLPRGTSLALRLVGQPVPRKLLMLPKVKSGRRQKSSVQSSGVPRCFRTRLCPLLLVCPSWGIFTESPPHGHGAGGWAAAGCYCGPPQNLSAAERC